LSQLPFIKALESGATIVTATRRLSRELTLQYDQWRRQNDDLAWHTADVLPWDAWIKRCWTRIESLSNRPPVVLSEGQLESVWTQIILKDVNRLQSESAPLWNANATAQASIRTLAIIRHWLIDARQLEKSTHDDHRCFLQWLKAYEKQCKKRNWIDTYQIATWLCQHIDRLNLERTCFIGFDRFLPQQKELTNAVKQYGIDVQILPSKAIEDPEIGYCQFDDDLSQWLAAGHWARTKLEHDPNYRIALVAPDLAKSKNNIEYALRQTLCPQDIIDAGDRSNLPFHISLGTPLAKHPVARSAVNLLSALNRRSVVIDLISELILSPHVSGAEMELMTRSTLDLQLRQQLPGQTNFQRVLEFLEFDLRQRGNDPCPVLRNVLERCDSIISKLPPQGSFRDWSKQFDKLLGCLGWPAISNPDSETFQAIKAVREQLHQLGELDLTNTAIDFESALSWLRQRFDAKIFQIEDSQVRVEVLGILEMSGLNFDCLWFGGLVEADWPPKLNPDPFLPLSLQKEVGLEGASAKNLFEFIQTQQQRLFHSAGEIVCSRHLYELEIAMEPSPLISNAITASATSGNIPTRVDQQLNLHRPVKEFLTDCRGPELNSAGANPGGSGLIQTQSLCPRGAFARYRLGAELILDNQPGLDNFERGAVVHKVLELVWSSIGGSRELLAISPKKLEQLISQSAQRALGRFRSGSGCGEKFFDTAKRWLVTTVLEWMQLEKLRAQPFEVLGLEAQSELELGGLTLNFKIDRIDRLEDGSLILIDYKTGSRNVISDWLSERPRSPQLPLYALSQKQPIEAVVWAQVRLGQCRFIGLCHQHDFADESTDQIGVKKFALYSGLEDRYNNWNGMLAYWNSALGDIAEEFVRGDARYDPLNHGVCSACPTPVICRNGDQFVAEETR